MAETAFETPGVGLSGGITGAVILDPSDPGTPVTVIETDDNWYIKLDWQIAGLFAPYVDGTWTVKAFLDDLDGGPFSGQVGSTVKLPLSSAAPLPAPRQYNTLIKVDAGKVPEGLYQLTIAITYDHSGKRLSMAGFYELAVMQFYAKDDA